MELKVTTASSPAAMRPDMASTQLYSFPQFAKRHPGMTHGGLRHMFFHLGQELEDAGAVIRFGRRILIDEARFLEWLRAGNGRRIAGGAR